MRTCAYCKRPAVHHITVRVGKTVVNPDDPKSPDLSYLRIVPLCDVHMQDRVRV